MSATSAQLQKANKTVWIWFGAAGAILLLVLLVGWAVLGYYRRELASTKAELQRYENAVPIGAVAPAGIAFHRQRAGRWAMFEQKMRPPQITASGA